MTALIAAAGLALAIALALVRLHGGPTLYDRVLALNAIAVRVALIGAAFAVIAGRGAWIDVSIALVLGLLVVNAAMLKFFRARSFQLPLAPADESAGRRK